MELEDRVYGHAKIKEPVLISLINSKPVRRLKGINQAGASQYALRGKTVSRYDHSLGVMILLKKLNAPLEEQIAGLLHDIPHTAFSHVIDFVFKTKNHEFHEKFHRKIITGSEIPSILKEHGFNIKRQFNERNFPLLEKNLPDLCADRIDYTLRDMVASSGFHDKINEYLHSFIVKDNEIVMRQKEIARKFAEDYLKMDEEKWSHPLEIALFQILADAIKIALDEKIISEEDLFQDDVFLYSKLKESKNVQILKKLDMLNVNLKIIDDPDDYHFHSKNKLRYINPRFINPDGSFSRVSDVYPDFKERLRKHKEWIERGNFVRVVSW